MSRIVLPQALILLGLTGPPAAPQPPRPPQERGLEREAPAAKMVAEFQRTAPKVGDPLPDVEALDADGKAVRLADLKGRSTVIVFGCLT